MRGWILVVLCLAIAAGLTACGRIVPHAGEPGPQTLIDRFERFTVFNESKLPVTVDRITLFNGSVSWLDPIWDLPPAQHEDRVPVQDVEHVFRVVYFVDGVHYVEKAPAGIYIHGVEVRVRDSGVTSRWW